jgi:hypothetical protein
LNLKKKPVQHYRIIWFLLLLFIITPGVSVEADHLRKFPVTRTQPSDLLANGTNGDLNISGIEAAGSTASSTTILSSATECYVQDPGFEAGTPNPNWDEYSDTYDSPIWFFNPLYPGANPHSGSWWAWFGGVLSRESGWVQQNVTFPAARTATLDFYLEIPDAATPGYLKVLLDGNLLFEATEADAYLYPDYALVSIDVSVYADGGSHLLRFESTTEAGDYTNFFVDDICVINTTTTKAMPWIPLLLLD